MTKEELSAKTDRSLYPSENALINFNIYHNPKHAVYYQKYHRGEYEWCYNYLIKNRRFLTIDHTPLDRRAAAEIAIQIAEEIYQK
jgi:hypothetical protein